MKQSNKNKRLNTRLADWAALMDSRNPESTKKVQRKEGGGYHKPGSNNK